MEVVDPLHPCWRSSDEHEPLVNEATSEVNFHSSRWEVVSPNFTIVSERKPRTEVCCPTGEESCTGSSTGKSLSHHDV